MNNHITPRELLLYADGELPFWRSHQVQVHLLSCWNCRRELERLEQDISAIVDAQNQSFLPSTPAPVRPWDNFEALAASLPPPRFRLEIWLRQAGNLLSGATPSSLRWTTAVVTLVCIVVTALWLTPERLSAGIVLHRMEQAELVRASSDTGQVIRQRLRVERIDRRKSTSHSVEVESWKAGPRSIWRGDIRDLEQRYRLLGLESSLPLSPVASERWLRETQAEPKLSRTGDEVKLEANSTREGNDVESVSIRVQTGSWQLEGIRLTFADSIFDIAAVDLTILKKAELSPELLAELESTAVPKIRTDIGHIRHNLAATRPMLDPLDKELHIQYRLHEIGADLSEPIELKRDHGVVVINARSASDERKRQLTEMFGDDPGIRLETEISSAPFSATTSPYIVPNSAAEQSPDKQLTEFFGSAEAQENFTRAVLNADASILSHLYALRSLAQHWPSNVEPTLSADARRELYAMVSDHLRALSTNQPELKQLLAPLLERFCGPGVSAPDKSSSHGDWRQSTTAELEAARALDRNLRALLTTSSNKRTLSEACPELNFALFALSSSMGNMPPTL